MGGWGIGERAMRRPRKLRFLVIANTYPTRLDSALLSSRGLSSRDSSGCRVPLRRLRLLSCSSPNGFTPFLESRSAEVGTGSKPAAFLSRFTARRMFKSWRRTGA